MRPLIKKESLKFIAATKEKKNFQHLKKKKKGGHKQNNI